MIPSHRFVVRIKWSIRYKVSSIMLIIEQDARIYGNAG